RAAARARTFANRPRLLTGRCQEGVRRMALAVGQGARGRKPIMQTQANKQSESSLLTRSIVPCVTTDKMRETRAFWVGKLGFELSYDHEHYLGVRGGPKGAPEIGFMLPDKEAPT